MENPVIRFAHVPLNFISLYFFVLTFAVQFADVNCKNYLKYFSILRQWKMMSDLNMCHEKMLDFVSFPLFGFALTIKLRNFDFESH